MNLINKAHYLHYLEKTELMNQVRYKELRNVYSKLVYKVLDTDNRRKENIIDAGTVLGFWDGEKLVFEYEEEMNVLTEYSLYEQNKGGESLIDIYKKQHRQLSMDENEILNGMEANHCSLFEIVDINIKNSIIYLKDQITKEIYRLKDINLSQTAKTEVLIFTRLIPVYNINMTSGLTFQFRKKDSLRILNELSSKDDNTYETIFRCNKLFGYQIASSES